MKSIKELIDEQNMNNNQSTEASGSIQESNNISENNTLAQQVDGYSSSQVIELLKQSLNIHWKQTTSLTAQSIHLERWGYKKLAAVLKADAEEEHNLS